MERIEIGLAIDAEERARVFSPEMMEKWKELRQHQMDGYRIGYLSVDGLSFDVPSTQVVVTFLEFSICMSGKAFRLMTCIRNNVTETPQLINAFCNFSRDKAARALVEKHIEDQLWVEGPF